MEMHQAHLQPQLQPKKIGTTILTGWQKKALTLTEREKAQKEATQAYATDDIEGYHYPDQWRFLG